MSSSSALDVTHLIYYLTNSENYDILYSVKRERAENNGTACKSNKVKYEMIIDFPGDTKKETVGLSKADTKVHKGKRKRVQSKAVRDRLQTVPSFLFRCYASKFLIDKNGKL